MTPGEIAQSPCEEATVGGEKVIVPLTVQAPPGG